ncbi:MAG: ABC transporter ATP-binding protein [Natronomonas sp.]|uniref:ABC transporter ATP-binding protein n=1 Tax=Natronomonas sp. TaxID=2184060 RepID=UPI0028703FF8|nr:ABC transporter ATP-binding protein [Natronomonas sp.]MDR9380269.1 ABC transporter ATP-binding protein [Natronomonas sp.]MDR9430638.1 ABC transporter ATP-binding protein [Natronomonas sp.]
MVTVRLENIVKRYDGDVLAVDNVSLDTEDGSFLTLVGPSGSGKSTILRMLAGVVTASEGRIMFGDKDVTDIPPQDRDVAMVFQNYALYPNMTVRENMEFGLKMQGVDADERRETVKEAAHLLQIQELLDRDVQQLSGGQQQRVALGRSVVRDPEVFLLDEPLANLDAKLRTEMRTTLVELQREIGVTTVYVTHNQIEAMTMSDKVAVLDKGRIQQLAAPQELYRNPANQFVADFIGTPSMNFLDVEARHADDAVRLTNEVFDISVPTDTATGVAIRDVTTDRGKSTLGIRPQDLVVSERGASEGYLAGQIEVVLIETAGDKLILHLEEGDIRVISVVNEQMSVEYGDKVNVTIDPERLHLFDPETGDALLS